MRDVLRLKHYAIRTETAYLEWARRFLLFHDIRTVQGLRGHQDVPTTMLYTHVLNRGGLAVRSPLESGGT